MQLVPGHLTVDALDPFVDTVNELGERHDATIQVFDARYVAGPKHLERALTLADRALDRGTNVARDRAVEVLCYAAGRRQIDQALELGVTEGDTRAVFLVDGPDETGSVRALEDTLSFEPVDTPLPWGRDEALIESYFSITAAERAATDATLEDLVCERVALLEVEK